MTNEYQISSVESECVEAEVEIYRHEVLRKLFACSSGKTSAAFSLISFVNGFSLFAYELLVLAVGLMGTMGFAIIVYAFAAHYILGSLALNLIAGILLFVFCLVSNSALRKLRSAQPFQPHIIKKAALMPRMRAVGLLLYSVFFLFLAAKSVYDLVNDFMAENPATDDFEVIMEYLNLNQSILTEIFWLATAFGLFLFISLAWFGVAKYYSRVYKYAASNEYKSRKKPPYFRMVLAIIICFLTFNIPTALYMIFTVRWFKSMHAGIVSARLLK